MRRGCLVKGLIISTILFAALFYVLTIKLDDWVLNPLKETFYNSNFDDVKENIKELKESPYKDSLITAFKEYSKEFRELKNIDLNEIGEKAAKVGLLLKDSTVSKEDFEQIKKILESKKQKNEKSKEN
ncbi:MAG: hypothetical protein AB9882_02415 [Ignavibacteriaceae bacterium]